MGQERNFHNVTLCGGYLNLHFYFEIGEGKKFEEKNALCGDYLNLQFYFERWSKKQTFIILNEFMDIVTGHSITMIGCSNYTSGG